MGRFVIDGDGKIWAADDDRLLEAMGYPDPDFEIISYAVRNLGYVGVELTPEGAALRFRSLTVRPAALQAAAEMLATLSPPPEAITIHSETQEWEERRFDTSRQALAWIATMSLPPSFRSVATQARSLNALANRTLGRLEQPDDHFTLMFKKWRLSSSVMPSDFAEFLVRFGLHDRASIAEKRDVNALVWAHMGSRITLYDKSESGWQYKLQGRFVEDQPDHEYGRYAEAYFRKTLETGEPAFDHVSAVVTDGRTASRFSYDRLLLPWKTTEGKEIVTSLSYKTNPDTILPKS